MYHGYCSDMHTVTPELSRYAHLLSMDAIVSTLAYPGNFKPHNKGEDRS